MYHLAVGSPQAAVIEWGLSKQGGVHMVDALAERGAEEEALCCVCGGGDSSKEAGNEIVFCERCDMAVHQKCYRVDSIPAGQP